MGKVLETSVKLINDSIMFECCADSLPKIITDYIPPLGDGKGYMPLQLFLISLSSCFGGTVAPLLRRMGKSVNALMITAKGQRREQHPTGFESIELDMILSSENATHEDVDRVIKMSEDKYCPVLSMIKGNVDVTVKYKIER
jgi:putative redox protein